ncbi:MAG: hypothetical protein REI78_15365 [Pedobacter sp.]|nr:hypothetical protein [Pedobacter sp.]MDQ8054410.1 hypothetical protein [Pedobacter sp.]
MKQKELTKEEKELVNGGGQSMSSATEISLGTDSLLSIGSSWESGDKKSTHNLEVGKGIDIDLGGNLNRSEGN